MGFCSFADVLHAMSFFQVALWAREIGAQCLSSSYTVDMGCRFTVAWWPCFFFVPQRVTHGKRPLSPVAGRG